MAILITPACSCSDSSGSSGGGRKLITSVTVKYNITRVLLNGLNLVPEKDYELIIDGSTSYSVSSVTFANVLVYSINGIQASSFSRWESIRYFTGSTSTYVDKSNGILLGYIRNYIGTRGLIISRFRIVDRKVFFFSICRADISLISNYNYITSSAFSYGSSTDSINSMEIGISNGEFFGSGTVIRLYEI